MDDVKHNQVVPKTDHAEVDIGHERATRQLERDTARDNDRTIQRYRVDASRKVVVHRKLQRLLRYSGAIFN